MRLRELEIVDKMTPEQAATLIYQMSLTLADLLSFGTWTTTLDKAGRVTKMTFNDGRPTQGIVDHAKAVRLLTKQIYIDFVETRKYSKAQVNNTILDMHVDFVQSF